MRIVKSLLLSTALLSTTAFSALADVKVVASIKPVHSLVAAVMEGAGTPDLIVDGAGSPHTYALKPSQARTLQEAAVVFWMGHQLEAFLEKPIEAIAGNAKAVELLDTHDLVKMKLREGGAFDAHDHGDHDGHDDHDEHKHEEHADGDGHDEHKHDEHKHEEHADGDGHDEHKHDEHKHEEHADGDGHDEHKHDEHAHGEFDPHVWLDPENAKALVHEIEEALSEVDPEHAATYKANAKAVMAKLDALTAEVTKDLAPVRGKGFVVFHDAYQNFENRFGLAAAGSITVSPEVMPGADRIQTLRAKVKEVKASCVFSEPQFEPRLVKTVAEGTDAGFGVLDPLGAEIENGPELYFTLIRNMATSFKTCLSK